MTKKDNRNLIGYGSNLPKVDWPNKARIAVQIVLNYEEGAENCVLNGDKNSEVFLSEIIGAQPIKGRHMNMESLYEYGSRVGFWRLHNLFQEKKIPITIFGVPGILLSAIKLVAFTLPLTNILRLESIFSSNTNLDTPLNVGYPITICFS